MEDNTRQPEQDGLKVLLKPEYYEKLKQEEAFDKLRNDIELTDEEKAAIDKWMSDPIRTSDSRIGHLVKDYWEHPERFKWFRDHVLFPTNSTTRVKVSSPNSHLALSFSCNNRFNAVVTTSLDWDESRDS